MFLKVGNRTILSKFPDEILEEIKQALDVIRPNCVDKISYHNKHLFILANGQKEIYWRQPSGRILTLTPGKKNFQQPTSHNFYTFCDGLVISDDKIYILPWKSLETDDKETVATLVRIPELCFELSHKFPIFLVESTKKEILRGFFAIQEEFNHTFIFLINIVEKTFVELRIKTCSELLCGLGLDLGLSYYLHITVKTSIKKVKVERIKKKKYAFMFERRNLPAIFLNDYPALKGVDIPDPTRVNVLEVNVGNICLSDEKIVWQELDR